MKSETMTIDWGNTIIKANNIHFLNRIRVEDYNENRTSIDDKCFLILDEKIYFMEVEGEKVPKDYLKTNRNFLVPTLYAIAKAYEKDNEINVDILGTLPIDQISQKIKLIDMLSDKTFEFIYNGIKKKVNIGKVMVVKECVAAFYTLKDKNGQKLLIDIGSLTTNIFVTRDGKAVAEKTVTKGQLDWYKLITERHIADGFGQLVVEEVNMMLDNKIFHEECKDIIEENKKNFTKELVEEIKSLLPSANRFEIVLVGGGAEIFFENLKDYYKSISLHSNPIFANINGLGIIKKIKNL